MAIYIMGDLHLSFSTDKPMNVFGEIWENHAEKIKADWISKVNENDTVIIPGDFSWAMNLEETKKDFEYLNSLPGKKIILKGNHDFWWTTVTNMSNFLKTNDFENIYFLHNNAFLVEDKILVGTRGWSLIDSENSNKMINREKERLIISINKGIEQFGKNKEIIAIMHYPPIISTNILNGKSEFLKVLKEYNIKKCFYAHLHGNSHKDAIEGDISGVNFKLVSADYLKFKLFKL